MADQTNQTNDASDRAGLTNRTESSAPGALSAAQLVQNYGQLPEDGNVEADSTDIDSALGDCAASDTTSLRSSIIKGIVEHGRRYQAVRDATINIPSDEKQFSSMSAGHMALTILESQQENPYFRSKLSPNAQHILDLGTGNAEWVYRFPNITVHGIDLYPPPQTWVPPNCILEVDDITRSFTYEEKFDLIHIRMLAGSLSTEQWHQLYRRCYDALAPGGWIEHYDSVIDIRCDDGTLPPDSLLANFGAEMEASLGKTGNTMKVAELMRPGIEAAGFTNIQHRWYKVPFGGWARHPIYKEAGECKMIEFKEGMQGWVTWALTKFGSPEPWSEEEVAVYVAKFRQELDQKWHVYQPQLRVWGQKPLNA